MTMHPKQFEIQEKQTVFKGYFQIIRYRIRHSRFDGGWHENVVREVFERGHAVVVLPYDPITDQVVLIEQFRIGATVWATQQPEKAWLLETIAGIIEHGETPENVAYRETQEEAHCEILELLPIYDVFVSPGGTTETARVFCARVDASKVGTICGKEDEHEDIQVHVMPFTQAYQLLCEQKIHSAPSIIALQWLALNRAELRQRWQVA